MPTSDIGSPALLPQWCGQLTTNSGLNLNVRPASPDDERALADLFGNVSPEDLRFRFLSSLKKVGPELLHQLADVDHDRTENLLAFDARDQRLAATAMVAMDEAMENAEVAVAVRSDLKGQGLGWALLGHACDYASARGIKRVYSVESYENRAAISLEKEMGFSASPFPGEPSLTLLTKQLSGEGS